MPSLLTALVFAVLLMPLMVAFVIWATKDIPHVDGEGGAAGDGGGD